MCQIHVEYKLKELTYSKSFKIKITNSLEYVMSYKVFFVFLGVGKVSNVFSDVNTAHVFKR